MTSDIHSRSARRALVGLFALASSLMQGLPALAQDIAEAPVSYATEQADRGEEKYRKECADCHGDDLKGGMNGGAPIRGLAFEEKYFGDTAASNLYLYMSTLMPPNSPGRFSPAIYADLMAYVLKRNGFRAGAELPSDLDALDALIMVK